MKKVTAKFPKAKILVADDYDINIELFVGMLELMDCSADTAMNGQEAWDLFRKNKYDIVLLDILMPKMDGYEVTKKIRKEGGKNKDTIIIAVTANALSGDEKKCLEAGMDDYISKPVKCEVLEEKFVKFLGNNKNG